MLVFLHPFYCFIILSMCQLLIFANVMHLLMLIWRGGGGGGAKGGVLTKEDHPWWGLLIITKFWGGGGEGVGFDKGRSPIVGTYNNYYCQVLGVRTFEVPLITDDILDWKL